MSFTLEELYNLLPAEYRVRDAIEGRQEDGGPLKALLEVLAEQIAVIEEDLAQLYDDQFIETCAEWVVPYIGDLIGARTLNDLSAAEIAPLTKARLRQRAQVANTIAYRRRKGTAAVLEQVARDASGWPARAVEFFKLLATSQHMNHVRATNHYSPDLRNVEDLERLNTPFEITTHTADVRRIATHRGRYNIPNMGVFLWRLRAYPLSDTPAFRVGPRRYRFHPLGIDSPLFTNPKTETAIVNLAEAIHVPMPISRRSLHVHLDRYYGPGKSLLIKVSGQEIDSGQIVACNLSDHAGAWARRPKTKYGIDPELGRIALPANETDRQVEVQFHYGFSADMGGGLYPRTHSSAEASPSVVPDDHGRIQDALDAAGTGDHVVEVRNNDRYKESLSIDIADHSHLQLRAEKGRRPTLDLDGELVIHGGTDSELTLDGLLITGGPIRVEGRLRRLRLRHCTLVPGQRLNESRRPEKPNEPVLILKSSSIRLEIQRSILGRMHVNDNADVFITDSIVDATALDGVAFAADKGSRPGGPLSVHNSTLLGRVVTRSLEASNTIFLARSGGGSKYSAPVYAEKRQEGCVRYSFLPLNAQAPKRYRCRPANASEQDLVQPLVTSTRYGTPGYAQLREDCPLEIREGADDGSEMGAFHCLFQAHRLRNARTRIDEYLRFNLEAGITFVD